MSNYKLHRSKKSGFTLIEMLIIAPIVLLTIGAFITVIVNMTGDVLASRGSNVLAYDIQDALNHIEDDVKLSTSFLPANNISFNSVNNPQGFGNDTVDFANVDAIKGNMLILSTLATTGNPLSSSSGVIYLNAQPNDCSTSLALVNMNKPMTMNVVYFIKTVNSVSSLWRRTITPVDYLTAGATTAGCTKVPWQQPSCSPGYSSSFCKTQDTKLVDVSSVGDFSVTYYSSASSTAANAAASDTSLQAGERNSALQSSTTVSASLNISKTIAGRTVSQSGTIRATRLDVNASTIADAVTDVIPNAPVISGSIPNPSTPTTVVFTWPLVPGATSYDLYYKNNAWNPVTLTNSAPAWPTTPTTSQTSNTYSVTVAHGDIAKLRVKAVSSAGASAYSTSVDVTVPVWAPMLLQNNWVDTGSTAFATAAYTKTSTGMIVLKGHVKNGTATANLAIATLPVGYRPSEQLIFENTANGNPARVDVDASGNVLYEVGSNADYYLDGITFMPSGFSFNPPLTLQNSWVWFGSQYAQVASKVDDAGRVQLKGLVKNGSTTSGNTIATLPSGSWPSEYLHIVNNNNNANSHISVNSSGNVLYKLGGNGFQSLQASFFPSARVDGSTCTTQWCTLTLQNSWVHYGAPYASPRYTKASDGVVQLKGLIKSGTTTAGTVIAALPVGYCPKQPLYMTAQGADAWARLLITAGTGSGCQLQASYVSASWTSLDAVQFLADW